MDNTKQYEQPPVLLHFFLCDYVNYRNLVTCLSGRTNAAPHPNLVVLVAAVCVLEAHRAFHPPVSRSCVLCQVARDPDLKGLRILMSEEFIKWDNAITVKVRKKAPAEELVRTINNLSHCCDTAVRTHAEVIHAWGAAHGREQWL